MIARRAGALAAAVVVSGAFVIAAAGPAAATIVPVAGYVWADQQTAASYSASAQYSYNSAGQTNTITRQAVGTYQVDFAGLAASSRGGTVDVSAYNFGSQAAYCKTSGWGGDGNGGTRVGVVCLAPNGRQFRDSRFTAMFTVTPPAAAVAYAWADQPTAGSYNPSSYYSYNGFGGAILITRQSYGQYTVLVRNAASLLGTVKVTAYGGDTNINCHPRYWVGQQTTEKILVDCAVPGGSPADSRFDITWTAGNNLTGQASKPSAYVSDLLPSVADYTPQEQFRSPDTGRAITVHRVAAGVYLVRIPDQATTGGHVQLNSYNDAHNCEVFRWLPSGTDEQVQVRCYDENGTALDTAFALQWVI